MDDVPLLGIVTNNQQYEKETKEFKKLAIFVVLEISLTLCFTILSFSLPSVNLGQNVYFILVYCHIGNWGLAMLLERFLRLYHKKLKLTGYFVVHKRTRKFNKSYGLVLAAGNLLLLTLSTVYLNFCNTSPCKSFTVFGISLKRINYFQIIVLIEFLLIIPMLAWYLAIIVKLIISNALPDVLQEERMFSFATRDNTVGRRFEFAENDELFERQANVIQCLQERNLYLASKIQLLQQQLN